MDDEEVQYVQSLLDAHKRQSYDLNKAHGDEIVSELNTPVIVARVNVDTDYARDWVVTLGAVTTPSQQGARAGGTLAAKNPQSLADSFCIVEWGMGTSANWAIVDWTAGQQFSVYGSYVKIHAQINTWGLFAVPPADPRTRFSGHIAPGRSSNLPTRTVTYGTVVNNDEEEQPVPPFARRVYGYAFRSSPASYASVRFRGRHVSGGVDFWQRVWGTTTGAAGSADVGVTLPVATNFLAIANFTSSNIIPLAVYELALS